MNYDLSDVNKKIERIKKTLKCSEPDRIPLYDFFGLNLLEGGKKRKTFQVILISIITTIWI